MSKPTSVRLGFAEEVALDCLRQHFIHHAEGRAAPERLNRGGMIRFAIMELAKREHATNDGGWREFPLDGSAWKWADEMEKLTKAKHEEAVANLKALVQAIRR